MTVLQAVALACTGIVCAAQLVAQPTNGPAQSGPASATKPAQENPVAAAARKHAIAMLEHEALPDEEGLANCIALLARTSADGDWSAVHQYMKQRGAILNAVRVGRARAYLKSAPLEFRDPGLDAMTDEEIAARTNQGVHVLRRIKTSKIAVMRLGMKPCLSENEALMTAPAATTPNRRARMGEQKLCSPFLYTPPDLDVDASPDAEVAILEIPADNFRGESLLLVISFAYFEDCGWLPTGSLTVGARHRPIM